MTSSKALGFCVLVLLALATAPQVHAEAPLVTLEASTGKAVTTPQSDRFGFGVALAVAAYGRVAPWLLLGGKLRAGALANGDAPSNPALVDPGTGTFESLSGLLRLRPFAGATDVRNALGFFIEAGGG